MIELFKKTVGLILIAPLLLTFACEKYLDSVREDPNTPATVTPDLLLPTAIVTLGYTNHGQVNQFLAVLMQQASGVGRCGVNRVYQLTGLDTEQWWAVNMYAGALNDLYILNQISEEKGYVHYAAMAKTLLAYGMLSVTQLAGDVPFSEAFQGAANLTPAYDRQEQVYVEIQSLLEAAIAGFDVAAAPISPGANDDLIYGGDVTKWKQFAQAMRARAFVHLGKVSMDNYQRALDVIDAGVFASEADDPILQWGTGPTEAGPLFQSVDQRGDVYFAYSTIHQMMTDMNDPRLPIYSDSTSVYFGEWFQRPDALFYFHSYMELKFIEAEAAFKTGDLTRAAAAHNAGVMASLERYGLSDTDFENMHASKSSNDINLEEIMTQKYIAMFLDLEVFADWRRTGIPDLRAVGGAGPGGIPRRLPYPNSEEVFNEENMPQVTNATPVWWDQ